MIRRGDINGIHAFVFEQFSKIAVAGWPRASHFCRGRDAPDLVKEARARSALVPAEDHLALVEWIAKRPFADFRSRLVAWNLSEAEAKRIHKTRIAEARASGISVVNPQPQPAPVPAPAS